MESSRAFTSRLASAILLSLLTFLMHVTAMPNTVQDKLKKLVFNDEDVKVERFNGKWRAQCMFDVNQVYDPSVPVYVKAINMFWGTGKYLGRVKVPEVTLENRSYRSTQTVQLRWTIVSVEDPDVVLLKGLTPLFEARVGPQSTSPVDIPEIYFNKILKPLAKNGELNGHFRLVIGVQEVRFSDGQVWQAIKSVSLVRTSLGDTSSLLRFKYLTPLLYFDAPLRKRPIEQSLSTAPCSGRPGLITPAFLYASLQVTDPPCREGRFCDINPETLLSVCNILDDSFCDQGGCVPEGQCNCVMGVGPCATCPDNDGDGHTAARCGGGDCDDPASGRVDRAA